MKKINLKNLAIEPFRLIDDEWFLITAGKLQHFNTMTASWGTLGILWNKPVFICFVRPTRHTYGFMEKSDVFSISFFNAEYRKILNYCGKYSGRDVDKMKETGLLPFESELGAIFFEQSRLMFGCRKLYYGDIDPARFMDVAIDKNYPKKDYHRLYVGEIVESYENK